MRYDDTELSTYAKPRHNVLSIYELREAGVSEAGTRRRIDRGTLQRFGPSVYIVGSGSLSFLGRARASALRGGNGSMVHMNAALSLMGIITYKPKIIDVLTPKRRRHERGICFHLTSYKSALSDFRLSKNIPICSVERAIRDLASYTSADKITKLLREARYQHLLNMQEINDVIERMHTLPGHDTMLQAINELNRGSTGSWSNLESLGFTLLHNLFPDEQPVQNKKIMIQNTVFIPDLRWEKSKVTVELDGPQHLYADSISEDAKRDRLLRSQGDIVIRVPWFDLQDNPDQIRSDVKNAITKQRLIYS